MSLLDVYFVIDKFDTSSLINNLNTSIVNYKTVYKLMQ